MGLLDTPPTRPRTYVEGTEVDPADMNELFDATIGARDVKPLALSWFNGTSLVLGNFDGSGAPFAAGYIVSTNGGDTAALIVEHVEPGDKLNGLKVWLYGDGAADLTLEIWKQGPTDAARTLHETITYDDTPAAWTPQTWNLAAALEVLEGMVITFIATASAAGLRIRGTSQLLLQPR
jgi:hypothetical protein